MEIFNKDVEVVGSLKVNPNNGVGDFLTTDSNGVITNRTPSEVLTDISDGGTLDANYIHEQGIPSPIWVITHNLGKFPSVSVVDTAGSILMGEITYNSTNELTVSFSGGTGGKAYLN